MSNLFHFLTDLAVSPQKQAAFVTAPDTLMKIAGLTEADKAILKSGEKNRISTVFASELSEPTFTCYDPGPDPLPDPDPPPETDTSSKTDASSETDSSKED